MAGLVGLSTTSCSEDDLDTNLYGKSGVNLLAFGPCPILRTNEIRITGTNMQNVNEVIFPGADPVTRSQFNNSDNQNIYVNVPDASLAGKIKLVAGKDTVTSITPITFEEAIEISSVTPTTGLKAGDVITIKGEYVWNVASITFTSGVKVEAEDFVSASRKEILVKVPLAAESGKLTFSDGADWEFESKENLEILGATVATITESSDFGQTVTITGTNLHTIEKVVFAGGVDAEFKLIDNNKIEAVVPADAKSGAVTLQAYSGAMISTPEVALPEVSITGINQSEDIIPGDVITLTGENFDRIIAVNIPGFNDFKDYTITGNTLTFTVPEEGFVDGNIVLIQNANIQPAQAVQIRKMSGVVWMGNEVLEGWSNFGVFSWSGDAWTTFQQAITGAGQLTFHFVQTKEGAAFNCKMGDWGTDYQNPSITPEPDGVFKPAAGVEDLVIDLTAEEAAAMFADGGKGFVIWGDGIALKYIKFVAAGAELVVWEGSEDMGSWSNQPYIGSDAGKEFVETNAKEGNVLRFYIEPASDEWQLQVFEGHWGPMYGAWAGKTVYKEDGSVDESYTIVEGNVITLTLTQAMIDAALTQQWWGGIFVCQGQKCVIKKITIAPL